MRIWETSFGRFCLAALCVVSASLGFWTSLQLMAHWDDLWSAGDFYQSGSISTPLVLAEDDVRRIALLSLRESWGDNLDYLERTLLERTEEGLQAERTNYRYRLLEEESGALLRSNLPAGADLSDCSAQETSRFTITQGEDLTGSDRFFWSENDEYTVLQVWLGDAYLTCDPYAAGGGETWTQYGWYFDYMDENWSYSSEEDSRIHSISLVLESAVTNPLTVQDEFWEAQARYDEFQIWLTPLVLVCLVTLSAAVWSLGLLIRAAVGRPDEDVIVLTWLDRVPYDLYLCAAALAFSCLLAAGDPITYNINQYGFTFRTAVGLALVTVLAAALGLASVLTTLVRLRCHTLLRGTLCWRLWARVRRFFREVARHWPVTRRAVSLFLLYLLGTALTTPTFFLIPVYQGLVLWALCRWVRQWRAIRGATARIVGGHPEERIDTRGMYRDLREHAEQLNDLGGSISQAVEERLKSERFKAELITNVSHDLKTPLTSIINYVDLLKKTRLDDPAAREYLEVLERKSQRLKKLTEDLVEASKASTGVLPVHLERLDFAQLLTQALGEYEDRFQRSGLTPVASLPPESCAVLADGRHLWRVMDNLLGNCCKYALSGTRVYLSLERWDGSVILTVKNVSRAPLNVSPEQLMERFVRGDSARSTEGSGLGLSIARSLTDLQGGSFRLEIDGDLFKAVVSLPAAPPETPPDGTGPEPLALEDSSPAPAP